MASEYPRRSYRLLPTSPGVVCQACNGWQFAYDTRAQSNDYEQDRCPECFRFNDQASIRARFPDLIGLGDYCFCLCGCADTDSLDDADFEVDSDEEESEDDEAMTIDARTEAIFASIAGYLHDAVSDEGTTHERRILTESPGHFAVAVAHNPNILHESSVANAENTIGAAEVSALSEVLEPWEAYNMVEGDLTRTWADYQRIFPEMARMGHTEHRSGPIEPQPAACRFCVRPVNPEWRVRFRSGNITICVTCAMIVRPADPQDDPDFNQYDPGLPGARIYCHCRCSCQATLGSQRQHPIVVLPLWEDHPGADNYNPFATDDSLSFIPLNALLEIAWLASAEGSDHHIFVNEIRGLFDLPNVRLSDNRNQELALLQDMQWALEDGLQAIHVQEYMRALRYLQLGLQIGRFRLHLTHHHSLMARLLEASNTVDQHIDTGVDNAIYTRSVGSMPSEQSTYSAPINNDGVGIENMRFTQVRDGPYIYYYRDEDELPDYETPSEDSLEEGEIRHLRHIRRG